MTARIIAVDGLRSGAGEALAVAAGGLLFSAGLGAHHLAGGERSGHDLSRLCDASDVLLAAAGSGKEHVAKVKVTLPAVGAAAEARGRIDRHFGQTALRLIVGGEPCGAGEGPQIELLAGLDDRPRRMGGGVRLGRLVFADAPVGDGGVAAGDLTAQAEAALSSLLASLAEAGAAPDDLVKVNNTAAAWHEWRLYNAVYDRILAGSQSARCSVGGRSENPLSLVQVEAIAVSGLDMQFIDSTQSGVGRGQFVRDPRTLYRPEIGPCKGPHTHGARAGDLVFIAGECPYDAEDRLVGPGDIERQTHKTLDNVELSLETLGASLADAVKLNVTVSDPRLGPAAVACLRARCGFGHALSVVAAPLGQYGLLVEIEAVAVRGSAQSRDVLVGGN
jgi:enamine deaminase RidA (YjgF/YER057c/UK114 family)